jgi:hypothetical protein
VTGHSEITIWLTTERGSDIHAKLACGIWELMPLQARDYLGHGDKLALQLVVKIREFTLGVGWLLVPDKGLDL